MRPLSPDDAEDLAAAFRAIGWSKPAALFHRYCEEESAGTRWTRVAERDGAIAGYVTLSWSSTDPELARRDIPEVMDLNVLPPHRRKGIGNALLDQAEAEAGKRRPVVGLRVGLHSGYGAAQRLYVRRGYVPDGSGAICDGVPVPEGARIHLDDDVTLRMVKQLAPLARAEPG